LTEGEVRANALAGSYMFHEYATTYWLELVERSLQSRNNENTISPNITSHLKSVEECRRNGNFDPQSKASTSSIESLASKWPSLHELLGNAVKFRHDSSTSQYQLREGALRSATKEGD